MPMAATPMAMTLGFESALGPKASSFGRTSWRRALRMHAAGTRRRHGAEIRRFGRTSAGAALCARWPLGRVGGMAPKFSSFGRPALAPRFAHAGRWDASEAWRHAGRWDASEAWRRNSAASVGPALVPRFVHAVGSARRGGAPEAWHC